MSKPGYGPWARLAYFRGSSEKGERVRGLIVPLLDAIVVIDPSQPKVSFLHHQKSFSLLTVAQT